MAASPSALRMGAALAWFWRFRGHQREGRDRLLGLLKQVECSDTEGGGFGDASGFFSTPRSAKAWARLLHAAGTLSIGARELDAALGYYEATLGISRRLGDRQGEARALLGLADAAGQRHVSREVISRGLSVRDTEALVKKMTSAPAPKPASRESAPGEAPVKDVHTRAAEDRLRFALGTKVRIARKGSGGTIEVDFGSEDELNRLYEMLIAVK